jgi:hypothetical protein
MKEAVTPAVRYSLDMLQSVLQGEGHQYENEIGPERMNERNKWCQEQVKEIRAWQRLLRTFSGDDVQDIKSRRDQEVGPETSCPAAGFEKADSSANGGEHSHDGDQETGPETSFSATDSSAHDVDHSQNGEQEAGPETRFSAADSSAHDVGHSHEASEKGKDAEIEVAIAESKESAITFENAVVQRAIIDSKVVQSDDGVVMLRLNRHAGAAEVIRALNEAPSLQECRDRVRTAQCKLKPEWAHGAWFFVPMTEELFAEGMVSPQELLPIHIVMLRQDEQAVRDALKEVPKALRPQLSLAKLKDTNISANQDPIGSTDDEAETPFEIVRSRTFLDVRPLRCATVDHHSAPARLENGSVGP